MSYDTKLMAYTIFPPTVVVLLATPLVVTLFLGRMFHGGWKMHPRYEPVYANTWQHGVIVLFVTDPTVSVASLLGFSCQDLGSEGHRLKADFNL